MTAMDSLIKAWDSAHWELAESLTGLNDEDLWIRAHPNLLSVGELASHIAYGEAHSFSNGGFSDLDVEKVRYYLHTKADHFALDWGTERLVAELKRVHDRAKADLAASGADFDTPNPFREGWTYGYTVEYMGFHVAYHAGQIYSVRHLLGHETVDN